MEPEKSMPYFANAVRKDSSLPIPHATVAVFIGEDKKSPVYHLRLDIFRFPDSPLCAWMENQTSCEMLADPVRHGIISPGNRHIRIKLFVTSLTFQMVAQNINLPTQGNIFIPVEFRDFLGLFHFGQPIRIFFFRRVQFPLEGRDMMVQCSFARRCIGKVHGVSQLQFRSKNPGIGNEIQPAPVCPVGGCCLMDGMDQERCVSIRSAISVIYPIPDFIFSVARMACGNPLLNIDILRIGPTRPIINRPGFPDTLCPCKRRLKGKPDNVRYLGGKQELIRLGVFDDVDVVCMVHASEEYHIASSNNGFVMKRVHFHGHAAHAGGRPADGINALTAARLALTALDMQRDTFKDEDSVRIHGIVINGGSAVNIVPEEAELEYQIRAKTPEAVRDASMKFDRAMHAGAIGIGARVTVETLPGYMPLRNDPDLAEIHRKNLEALVPGAMLRQSGHRGSSSDFGDITMILPGIHPYIRGWQGIGHTPDFHVSDEYKAYVEPAKLMVMDVIDLLYGDAAEAGRIAAKKPPMTKEEYLDFLESMNSTREYGE